MGGAGGAGTGGGAAKVDHVISWSVSSSAETGQTNPKMSRWLALDWSQLLTSTPSVSVWVQPFSISHGQRAQWIISVRQVDLRAD